MTATQRISESPSTSTSRELIAAEDRAGVRNYKPLDVVLTTGSGAWLTDVDGRRYLDCLSSYSAVNHGHCHPRLVAALSLQAERLTLTSRAFRNDQLAPFLGDLTALCGMDKALPMNTGAEAVETAIKAARRWGYDRKLIPDDRAEIVVFDNNFHGRTTTIVGFSSEAEYRRGFGPFAPGFRLVPFGDIEAVRAVVNDTTCAILFEPVQCEAGVIFPPDGFIRALRELCDERNVLLIADEIQTGLGRMGRLFACDYEDVRPDMYVLGKALSGGMYPVSAVVASDSVMSVFDPGSHGSTFGGNPLACAVAREALAVMREERFVDRAAELGEWLLKELRTVRSTRILDVRGRGLMVGIELHEAARPYCEALAERGLLCKETHDRVIRVAPPLIVAREDLEFAVQQIREALE
ncbi:ornithine aminotransferase [soil metagenome]